MIVKTNGFAHKALMFVANPCPLLPRLLPLWAENVRVGNDCTTWCRVFWHRA